MNQSRIDALKRQIKDIERGIAILKKRLDAPGATDGKGFGEEFLTGERLKEFREYLQAEVKRSGGE